MGVKHQFRGKCMFFIWGFSWGKLKIALFGELSLEEAIDLSEDRQILD
jgi:hypothetical protein